MIEQGSQQTTLSGRLGAFWGVAGVSLMLSFAVYRLMVITIDSFAYDFQWYHWLALLGNIFFMAYTEGYKGFQRGFSPRVAARARYIQYNPRLMYVLAAPLFCMSYFFATRKRLIVTYTVTITVIFLVNIFHHIVQPWRGILDAGVVVGLSWGIASLVWYSISALGAGEFEVSAEVPLAESGKL
jgi:hypothetical protein